MVSLHNSRIGALLALTSFTAADFDGITGSLLILVVAVVVQEVAGVQLHCRTRPGRSMVMVVRIGSLRLMTTIGIVVMALVQLQL